VPYGHTCKATQARVQDERDARGRVTATAALQCQCLAIVTGRAAWQASPEDPYDIEFTEQYSMLYACSSS